jgi:diguanylate cyclase (GGDEF)-like protein/PAS domain S-box-containing protein
MLARAGIIEAHLERVEPMLFCGIRARILGLVVASTVPFVALIGMGLWDQWRSEHLAATERALHEARLIAAQIDDHIGDLDSLLTGLSHAVSTNLDDTKANNALLRKVKSELPDYVAHILLYSVDGYSIATSLDADSKPIYVGDRPYFQKILAGERFLVGDVFRGRASGKWITNVIRRVEDQEGRLRGVLAVGTWLEHFQDALRLDTLPRDSVIRIVNEKGIVIAQSVNGPNWIGRDLHDNENVARDVALKGGSEVIRRSDDVEHITGSSTSHRAPWLVSVGIPSDIAFTIVASRLGWGALFSIITFVIAFTVAWMFSGRILHPLHQLGKDASVLASGELSHRSTIKTRDELGDLATSFNALADSIEQRNDEAKRSSDEIREAKDALAALIESVPVPIVVKELTAFRYVLVNQAYEEFIGASRDQIIGKTSYDFYPSQDADKIIERDKRALRLDEPVIAEEFSVHTPDDDLRTISTTRLVLHASGNTAGRLVTLIEDVTERRKAEATIFHMAHHDALTGLPNRAHYYERLEQALKRAKRGEHFAVFCLDMDNFKNVNDTYGHSTGDELLKTVADRLRDCVRETDTVARLGGDEFAIIQTAVDQPIGASTLADRIRETVKAPMDLDDFSVRTNVSIGISLASAIATTPSELVKQADMALYRAKAAGRNCVCFFEPEMAATLKAREEIESDLRSVLIIGGLELHYQPVVNIQDNAIVGMEALLRWRHPKRGLLSPADFIPFAEETGLIVPLGEWVLRQACSDAVKWPGDIKLAVNLSPAQIKDRGLARFIITTLATSGLPPSRLELEITEKVLLQDDEKTLALLHQLRELGVQIVMDDFGTGYSSLNYLRRFPLDKIKIDRSFIRDLADGSEVSMAVVRAVVEIAKALKVRTTAEGIETEEQLDIVRGAGCTEMQGYLFSRPKPVADLWEFLPQSADNNATAA